VFHVFGCVWFAISRVDSTHNWVLASGIDQSPMSLQYYRSVYFAVVTTATVGYGDIIPQHMGEFVFCFFATALLTVIFFVTLAYLTVRADSDGKRRALWERQNQWLFAFLSYHKVDKSTIYAVNRHLEYLWGKQDGYSDECMLRQLPTSVHQTVLKTVAGPAIAKLDYMDQVASKVRCVCVCACVLNVCHCMRDIDLCLFPRTHLSLFLRCST
jgi:hypothetical protein